MAEPSADDLKSLAEMRADDARVLFEAGRHSGAYYLAGYAIECALKAIIAYSFRSAVIPSKRLVDRVHTHDLNQLVALAGVRSSLEASSEASSEFRANWAIVAGWSEASRYEILDPFRVAAMIQAVNASEDGVLPWLKKHW